MAGVVTDARTRPDAVIFDLDGLLIDSEPVWRRVQVEVFAEVGLAITEEDALATTGVRVDEVVAHWFLARPWTGATPDEVTGRIVERMVQAIRTEVPVLPGVAHAVAAASSLGVPLALASSSPLVIIDAGLDRLGCRSAFAAVQSAEHLPKGKPDPEVYVRTAEQLGVDSATCVAVEDSPNGVRAAKAAGMRCVAVPAVDHRDEVAALADIVLGSLAELTPAHLTG